MLSMASDRTNVSQHIARLPNCPTDDPVHVFEQRTAILFPPQLSPRIDLDPPRELPQSVLKALDLQRPHISEAGSSVPIQRGQRDIVKIHQPDLRNSSNQWKGRIKDPRITLLGGKRRGRTYDLASMTAAQLPTPPHPITATLAPRIFFIPSSPKNA